MQNLSGDKARYNALKTRLRLRIRQIRRALGTRHDTVKKFVKAE